MPGLVDPVTKRRTDWDPEWEEVYQVRIRSAEWLVKTAAVLLLAMAFALLMSMVL